VCPVKRIMTTMRNEDLSRYAGEGRANCKVQWRNPLVTERAMRLKQITTERGEGTITWRDGKHSKRAGAADNNTDPGQQ
jgi:hypothetical protein